MIPVLFAADETEFDTNGLGVLADEADTTVIEGAGKFELEMKYPVTGLRFHDIAERAIIMAKPDPVRDAQPFRIYRITKATGGLVTVYARHLAYDNIGNTCSPFSAENAVSALQSLKANAVEECPFTFWTDVGKAASMSIKTPQQIWTLMGSGEGCILDLYGGEYEFDRYIIRLWSRRGADRGVSIRYGKNLKNLEQDRNIANCYTAVHPYWTNTDGICIELPEKIVKAKANFGYTRIIPLDLSKEFKEQPTEYQLRAKTLAYIAENNIGVPITAWKVEFEQLEKTAEYKGKALLEQVQYGDTVSVYYEELDIEVTARANEVRYKPRLERYESIALGDVKNTLADTIINQKKQINSKPSMSQMQIAIQTLTAAILGAKGGAVRLLDTDGDDVPDTLYIADNPDPAKAVKVWRFNYEGWGASKNGYNGPFVIGASFDSGILADFITAGTLYGMLIKAGVIESEDGKVRIDLNNSGFGAIFNKGIVANDLIVQADANNPVPVLQVTTSADRLFSAVIRSPEGGEALCCLSNTYMANAIVGIWGSLCSCDMTKIIGFEANNNGAEISLGANGAGSRDNPIRLCFKDGSGTVTADSVIAGGCVIDSSCKFVWNADIGAYLLVKS